MADQPPTHEFGKRQPAAVTTTRPVKRSGHVALLVMGSLVVGGGAYGLIPRENCEPPSPGMGAPAVPQTGTACGATYRGSSGSSAGYGRSTHFSFFGSDSSDRPGSSESSSAKVTRGGFGSLAHAFGFSGHS